MIIVNTPENEQARLMLLHSLEILDSPPEESFDRFVRILSELTKVPIALVSMIDQDRQWSKAKIGYDVCEMPRKMAFCDHALHVPEIFVLEDASRDESFADHPLVVGGPSIRFYAGVPLRNAQGLTLGTLCAMDNKPRSLEPSTIAAFKDLARLVERELLQRSVVVDSKKLWAHERQVKQLSDSRFKTIFEETPVGKAVVDLDRRFVAANTKFCAIFGGSLSSLLELSFDDIVCKDDLENSLLNFRSLFSGNGQSAQLEMRIAQLDGSLIWVQAFIAVVNDAAGKPLHYIVSALDISIRKQSEALIYGYQQQLEREVMVRTEELNRSRDSLQTIADNLPVLIAHVDCALCYNFNNDMYRQVFGHAISTFRGRAVSETLSNGLFEELKPYFNRALNGERVTCEDVRYDLSDGRIWSLTCIPDVREGGSNGFFIMSHDVTEQRSLERSLIDDAMRDSLTSLPNRRALEIELDALMSKKDRQSFALFFLDLDGFKAVNDQYGHDVGDQLLISVAHRLKQTVRKDDYIYRLGGDEFVAIAKGVNSPDFACQIAKNLCAALSRSFDLSGQVVHIGTSVGCTICPSGNITARDELISISDAAMYEAKRAGRNGFRFSDVSG